MAKLQTRQVSGKVSLATVVAEEPVFAGTLERVP